MAASDTEAEKAAIFAVLEKQRLKLERGKPLTIAINGQEYGRQHYIHQERLGKPHLSADYGFP